MKRVLTLSSHLEQSAFSDVSTLCCEAGNHQTRRCLIIYTNECVSFFYLLHRQIFARFTALRFSLCSVFVFRVKSNNHKFRSVFEWTKVSAGPKEACKDEKREILPRGHNFHTFEQIYIRRSNLPRNAFLCISLLIMIIFVNLAIKTLGLSKLVQG